MNNMNKIVIDAFGGDFAPSEIVKGGIEAVNSQKQFGVAFVGYEDKLNEELKKYSYNEEQVEIIPASSVITNEEAPTVAIRTKKDSSIVVAMENFKKREDLVGFVSAGSTGAVLTGAVFKVGRIKGIARPCLAPLLPTVNGRQVLLADCGANVDCKPEYIGQFALMATHYMINVVGVKNPRVALLSNGTEDKKGNELNHAAFAVLKEMNGINFVGNMEARDLLFGEYDIVVTDGFPGNVALKSHEGAILAILKMLKTEIMATTKGKIGGLFLKSTFKRIAKKLDYNKSGGAPLLGIDKVIIKSHGSSKASSIMASCIQAYELYESKYIDAIKEALKKED